MGSRSEVEDDRDLGGDGDQAGLNRRPGSRLDRPRLARDHLHAAFDDHPNVGDIRSGKGLLAAVELVEDKVTRKPLDPRKRVGAEICQRIRDHGVILRPLGDVIVINPPLAIRIDELERIVLAVESELRRTES